MSDIRKTENRHEKSCFFPLSHAFEQGQDKNVSTSTCLNENVPKLHGWIAYQKILQNKTKKKNTRLLSIGTPSYLHCQNLKHISLSNDGEACCANQETCPRYKTVSSSCQSNNYTIHPKTSQKTHISLGTYEKPESTWTLHLLYLRLYLVVAGLKENHFLGQHEMVKLKSWWCLSTHDQEAEEGKLAMFLGGSDEILSLH